MIREFDSFTARLDGVNLIEAAAGTGKTYNIENLVLRFVLERQLPVTSIVVVTYTEAAAMELRERIRRMFRAVAAAASAADPERVCRLRTGENADYRLAPRELRLFEQGVAATSEEDFSAGVQVVLRLLKRAVADFDRAPVGTIHSFCNRILAEHAFSGIEGGNGRLDQEGGEAADQFIDDFYRGSFYGGADAELRRNCFVPLADFRRYLQLALAREQLRFTAGGEPPDRTSEAIFSELRELSDDLRNSIHPEMFDGLDGLLTGDYGRTRDGISKLKSVMLPPLLKFASEVPAPDHQTIELIASFSFRHLDSRRSRRVTPETLAATCAAEPFFRIADRFSVVVAEYRAALLREAAESVRRRFERFKLDGGILTFDDLIRLVRDAMVGGEVLPRLLREKFPVGIIDEFQDTDPAQYTIFRRLFGDGGTLFLVGDPRQAIYGFRGGDLHTYYAARREVPEARRFTLSVNYRACGELIAAVNRIFTSRADAFADPELTLPEIREPADPSLRKTTFAGGDSPDNAPFSVICSEEGIDALTGFELCAAYIAGQLAAAVPAVGPEEIAVLVRTWRDGETLKQLLERRGIAAVVLKSGNVFASESAPELLTFLEGVVGCADPASTTAALLTSFGGLTGADVVRDGGAEAATLERMREKFFELNELWRKNSFIAMFGRLLDLFELRPRLAALPDGERRLADLLLLGDILHTEATRNSRSPESLLDFFRTELAESKSDSRRERYPRLPESDRPAVRLLTVHGAKGLEYPLVIALSLGFAPDEQRDPAFHNQAGELVCDLGDAPEYLEMRRREKLQEELRLAYVALTRAARRCVVIWSSARRSSRDSALEWLFADGVPEIWRRQPPLPDGTVLTRPQPDRLIPPPNPPMFRNDWRFSSFSELVRNAPPPSPVEAEFSNDTENSGEAAPPSGLRGTGFGNLVHRFMEQNDFALSETEISRRLEIPGATAGLDAAGIEQTARMIFNTLNTPLPGGVLLREISPRDRRSELEFCYALRRGFFPGDLLAAVSSHPEYRLPEISPPPRQGGGFMTGFIDLLFRRDGKFFVLDWKTNFLGDAPENYAPPALARVMSADCYFLQYLIYCSALTRYLRHRLRMSSFGEAEYRQYFGGVYYLFLRGITPERPGYGVFFDRPRFEVISEINGIIE